MNNNEKVNLILDISEHNWGLISSLDWVKKTWYIYDNLTIKYIVEFNSCGKKNSSITYKINNDFFNQILNNIEQAKKNNVVIKACDGEAWEFIQYNGKKIVWQRDLGYIYGITPLEKVSNYLLDLVHKK